MHQRWTAEVRRRKKEQRRREENALIGSDLQEMLLDPRDDDLIDDDPDQLDDEPTLSTMDQAREVYSDEHEPAGCGCAARFRRGQREHGIVEQ